MKKSSYIGLAIIILVFAIIVVPKIIDRLTNNATVDSSRSIKPGFKALDFIKINGESKKVPEFLFLNQDSIYVSNEDYLGKVYVAEFFFTTCPSICPIMNKNMKILHDAFGNQENFGIASFTIDPDHDTPSVLKKYAESYVGSEVSWNFLTGPKSSVYDLANKGFNIFAEINPAVAGGFEHKRHEDQRRRAPCDLNLIDSTDQVKFGELLFDHRCRFCVPFLLGVARGFKLTLR